MCLHAFKTESMGATWIAHVKKVYAAGKSKGLTYKQAMQAAKKTWKKKGAAAAKKGKAKEAEAVEEVEEAAPKKKRRKKKA